MANTWGVVEFKLQWVLGHVDFTPNKKADINAKKAVKGNSSPNNLLPTALRRALPYSISVIFQVKRLLIHHRWIRQWKVSSRYPKSRAIDKTTPSKNGYNSSQVFHKHRLLILQFGTGCVPLNKYLHHIKQSESLACTSCPQTPQEMVHHFLFECKNYSCECFTLQKTWVTALLTYPTYSPTPQQHPHCSNISVLLVTLGEHSVISMETNKQPQSCKYHCLKLPVM